MNCIFHECDNLTTLLKKTMELKKIYIGQEVVLVSRTAKTKISKLRDDNKSYLSNYFN